MSIKIERIECYLPEKVLANEFLHQEMGIDSDFLENKIGIKERRIAAENESTSDMAVHAATKLLETNPFLKKEIGLLILCTQTPDYRLPTTACIVQHRLDLSRQCMAFDVNLGCSGFVYCLALASACLQSGFAKKGLLVMTDQYSRIIDTKDRNTVSVFGDAATATLVSPAEAGEGLVDHDFGTDGSGAHSLIAHNSGIVKDPTKSSFLHMNGREVFKFSMSVVPESVTRILERNSLKVSDIRYFVFHQANKYMLEELRKRLGIAEYQMIVDLQYTGNTVSSSIPLIFQQLLRANLLRKSDRIIFCGFGVGLSWATSLYIF